MASALKDNTGTIRRSFRIAWAGAKYFIFYKLNGHAADSLGTRLRLMCEDLGLVFVKLGQVLSTRYDILSRADGKELQKLLDRVPPFPIEEARRMFREDFGKEPEDLFAKFDPQPIASASIAQVYVAWLADGTKLAVKVRRPGVERHVRADMAILRRLAAVARLLKKSLRRVNTSRIIGELEHWVLLETDFANEVRNIDIVVRYYHNGEAKKIAGEYADKIVFPLVHKDLSSGQVITMDFMEGVLVKDIASIKDKPGYDAKASLKALMGGVLRVWMEGDVMYYHGDPHPSNVFIRPNGELGLVDFGILGHFRQKDLDDTRDLMLAVYTRNVEQSIRLGMRMSGIAYTEALAEELRPDMESYIERIKTEGLGFWFIEYVRMYLQHDLPLPYQLTLFGRMNVILDGLASIAAPDMAALDFLESELKRAVRRRIVRNITSTNFLPVLYAASEKMKESPEAVAGFVDKYFNDPMAFIKDLREALR